MDFCIVAETIIRDRCMAMRIESKEFAEGLDCDDGTKTLLIFVKAIFYQEIPMQNHYTN
jgi:hypothetical protein